MSAEPTYLEPSRTLEVLDRADVVVVGGGAGGVGAAIAAARNGAKTLLVERFGCLGGTWTSGLLGMVMVNWTARGIFEEFRRKLAERGAWNEIRGESWKYWGGDAPPADPASYEGTYDVETAKVVLDEMAAAAGVRVLYFAQAVHAFKDASGRRVTGVAIQSKEGRHALEGKVFVDSSGDGDLCALAGAEFDLGRPSDGALQPMTMIFTVEKVDTPRALAYLKDDWGCHKAFQAAAARKEVTVPRDSLILNPAPKPGRWNFNCTRLQGYDGTKLRDVSAAMVEGRRQVAEVLGFLRKHIPGFEKALVAETAAHIGVRETRRIRADYTITGDDIRQRRKHPDAIARGNWLIDIHSPKGTDFTPMDPIRNGEWYEIPYRSTTVRGFDNLFIACRGIDATHEGHGAIRASPQVCAIGEGVGIAAAQMIAEHLTSSRAVDITALQAALRRAGALV
jgi:hypothetical protein